MKKCTLCGIEKELSEFCKHKGRKFGVAEQCKICRAEKARKYYESNKEIILAKNYEYAKKRLQEDICLKLARNLRCRLNKAIKNNQKTGSAIDNLGCSIEEFKKYIESLWRPGMNWDNNSHTGWHIDHIKPLSAFNLNDEEELKKACHYTNLQPLWYNENMSKSGKYDGK